MAQEFLRVAMFTNLFYPVVSGSATHTRGLARSLSEQGHHVIVITPHVDPSTPKYEVMEGFEVHRIPAIRLPEMPISLNFPWLSWTLWPKNLRRIENLLKQHNIQLLHIHNHMFDMALNGVLLKRRLKIPAVLTIHTVIQHSVRAFNLLLYPADRFFLRHAVVRRVDAVVCPDANIQNYLRQAFGRVDGKLVPYGISLPPHPGPEIETDIIERFGLQGRRLILSLGNVNVFRNRLDLIRAMPEVRSRFPNVLLLIVGGIGDQRPVELVKQLGLEDNVLFTGAQPHEHMSVYHNLAEIEAMWLDQDEAGQNSIGIAGMEAMLSGKPILTVSNVDAFGPGVLTSGRNVVILKAGDHEGLAVILNDLLAHPEKSQQIGQSAQALARNLFTWPQIAAKTTALYRSLIGSFAGSPFSEKAASGSAVVSAPINQGLLPSPPTVEKAK